ncbi:MAG: cell division protein, partial [Pseudomonadales bacterium]|nr:cell division protein [Pseudomonadales bacterium]
MSTTPRATGASVPSRSLRDRLRAWQSHHRRVARESIVGLLENWISSAMTWLVIGIALALPAILYVLLVNVGSVSESWEGKPRISLYLQASASDAEGRALAAELDDRSTVESTRYISAADALEEFRARSGFAEVVASLEENPLPAVVIVVPEVRAPAELRVMVSELEA